VVVCVERDADLHTAQLMPLSLTVSCISKIRISFTFLVPAHPGTPGKGAVKRVCVCVYGSCRGIWHSASHELSPTPLVARAGCVCLLSGP